MASIPKRYASIDFLRGFAIFSNVLVHIFTDVFDLDPIAGSSGALFSQPISVLLLLIAIGYLGSFGSLFIMISATGNMVSMLRSNEKGIEAKKIITKQIVGGIILLVFSFLVEGFFQFYGYLGTIFAWNGHPHDPTRIVWHAFTMTPVHCLAFGMIFTGIVQGLLARNNGFTKHKRNIIVYIILAIIVIAFSQLAWDICKTIIPYDFPNGPITNLPGIDGSYPGDYRIYMPPPNATFFGYISHFFLMMAGGSNHPIFPFLAMTFIGNVIGILMVQETKRNPVKDRIPTLGMWSAFVVFLVGITMIFILGVDFNSVLPIDAVGDITKINSGLDGFWIPWFCFLLAGEILVVFMFVRLVEYRGLGSNLMKRSKTIRRFGLPAFSTYAWHRFWSIPAIVILSTVAGLPSWAGGSITGTALPWYWTIIVLAAAQLSCLAVLVAWEKVGYVGGIEWMIGTVASGLGFKKAKASHDRTARWWIWGMMDARGLLNAEAIDISSRSDDYITQKRESKLGMKLAIGGLLFGPVAFIALSSVLDARRLDGKNQENTTALILSVIGICLFIGLVIFLSLVTFGDLGISF